MVKSLGPEYQAEFPNPDDLLAETNSAFANVSAAACLTVCYLRGTLAKAGKQAAALCLLSCQWSTLQNKVFVSHQSDTNTLIMRSTKSKCVFIFFFEVSYFNKYY